MNDLSYLLASDKQLKIIVASSDEAFNSVAAEKLCSETADLISSGVKIPNITLARGNTQTGIYQEIAKNPQMIATLSSARFFQLDEVFPATKTFADFTEDEILSAVFGGNIPADRWRRFDLSQGPDEACVIMRHELE